MPPPPPPTPPSQRRLELLVMLVIVYSVVVLAVELELDDPEERGGFFWWSELFVAAFFTVEYVVRWVASRSWRYPLRPMAVVDLLATLPFYVGALVDLRSLRLVRVARMIRLLRLYRYTDALRSILNAFYRVRYEFGVIGFALLTLGWICTVLLYELEREAQPEAFGRLSDAAWCTIVTITTVGYGDKVPATPGGKLVALVLMLGGLGLFGTFVSLIGSAFLEELRRNPRPEDAPPPPGPPAAGGDPPDRFDPDEVLRAVEAGRFAAAGPDGPELTRLLAAACRRLLARDRPAAGPGG
jgi:voltage-gated potassium channel